MRFASVLLLALFALSLHTKTKRSEYAGEAQKPEDDHRGTQDVPLVVQIKSTPPSDKDTVEAKKKAEDEAVIKKKELNLTVVIAVAAAIQAGAVIWQIFIYRKQSKIMKDSLSVTHIAAIAAQASAETTLKSVKLQEAKLKQWVDIDDWKNQSRHFQQSATEATLVITFLIGNPTEMPLTLARIDMNIGKHGNLAKSWEYVIAPDNGYTADLAITLKGEDFSGYKKGEFVLGLKTDVAFVDVLGIARKQHFAHLLICGPGKCEAFEHESKHDA